ncbi:MAG: transporter [Desulfohalobiaceae bacterium]
MVLTKRMLLLFVFCAGLVFAPQVQAGFQDVLNFEDNRFLPVDSLEFMHSYQFFSDTEPEKFERHEFTYQLTYAAVENFEMGATMPVVFFENQQEEGFGDLSIFQRYKFLEQQGRMPELSAGLELIFPTGDKDLAPAGSNKLDARLYSSVSQEMALGWKWVAQLGYRFYGDKGVEDRLEYNLGLNYTWGSEMRAILEFNGLSGGVPDQDEYYISPGINVRLRQGLSAAFSIPMGLNSDAASHKAQVQFRMDF